MFKCQKDGITKAGFTLIEVLVGLGAMAIGFVILMGLHYSSVRMEWSDTRRTQAMEIARRNLEMLRDPAKVNGVTCPAFGAPNYPASESNDFTCTVTAPAPPWSGSVQVSVTVTWKERLRMAEGRKNTVARPVQLATIYDADHVLSN